MTIAVGSLKLQPSPTAPRNVSGPVSGSCQSDDSWLKMSRNPKYKTSLTHSSFLTSSHFQEKLHSELQIGVLVNYPRCRKHQTRVCCRQSSLAKELQCLESLSFSGCIQGCILRGCLQMNTSPLRARRKSARGESSNDEADNGIKTERRGELEFCPKRSGSQKEAIETANESGYVIKVSRDLMSVFQYVEKVKRARLKELSETLRQVAYACLFFSCLKGIVTPLVEVFKTQPPSWSKLIMVLGAFDAFAITYLALKASQPLERLSSLATECESESNMMGSIEKEEEYMLALALDLVRLFRRLRNLALGTAVTQFAHILHTMLQLKKSYPNFALHLIKVVNTWLSTPWV